ncbi:MAG: transposase [Methylococcales bacterium]
MYEDCSNRNERTCCAGKRSQSSKLPQALRPMLTEGVVDWAGFGDQLARETNAWLGGPESVLILDESAFAKKGAASAGVARQGGTAVWARSIIVRSGCLPHYAKGRRRV